MIKQEHDILDNDLKNFEVPQNYFISIEDKVLKNYHRRQNKRKLTYLGMSLCGLVIVVSGVFFIDNIGNNQQQLAEKFISVKDTLKSDNNNLISLNNQKDLALNSNIEGYREQTAENEIDNKTIGNDRIDSDFTASELDYLENYLNEDNYELVYNTLMK